MPSSSPLDAPPDDWLEKLAARHPDVRLPGYWTTIAENAQTWAKEVTAGPFWGEAKRRLDRWRHEYRSDADADLLVSPGLPDFTFKDESKIRDKVHRLLGHDPKSAVIAEKGPPIPKINDLVRTRVACRYIDGVEFLATRVFDLAREMGRTAERSREGRLEGYFAQHVTLQEDVIYRVGGHPTLTKITCEIQFATEMATRMWEASHPLYESVRERR